MQEKTAGEIDLNQLFFDFAYTIKKNIVLIISLVTIFASLGVVYSLFSKKVYESKMIITSGLLTFSYSEQLIENINLLVREHNYELAATNLNVNPETVGKIIELEVTVLYEEKAQPLKENEKGHLVISVQATDASVFAELEKGLLYYFENNHFVKVRVEQRKQFYKQMIERLEKEIADLQQFKQNIINGNFFQEKQVNIMFDPTAINTKILELSKESIGYKQALELSDNVQLISGFTAFSKPIWPRKSVAVAIGCLIGLALAGLVIIFRSIVRGIENYDAKKPAA
jgi:hypothetical protein